MKKLISTDKYFTDPRAFRVDILPLAFIFTFVLLWEAVVRLGWVEAFVLPAPTMVLMALVNTMWLMKAHILATLFASLIGFGIAMLMAVLIAISMDMFPIVRRVLYPLIITSQTVPIITLAPLFAMWFGFGYLPKIAIVVLVCFFPITISLLEGLASVDRDLLNLLVSMGAKPLDIYKIVKLPASLANFFAGLKISGTYSIMGAVVGEWVGGKKGLGVYMMRVRRSFATDRVFATILVIVVLSIGVLKVINYIENKIMPWNKVLEEGLEED